ncbi:hypothetical protein [Sphingomonas sp. 1P08PE]
MNRPAAISAGTSLDASFEARFTSAEFLRMNEAGAFDAMMVVD